MDPYDYSYDGPRGPEDHDGTDGVGCALVAGLMIVGAGLGIFAKAVVVFLLGS